MDVAELCTREVIIVGQDATILAAAKLMRQFHVGNLVVVEKRQGLSFPLGILTDRDIVIKLVAGEVDFETVTVGDVMSADLLTVGEEETIAVTIKKMRSHGVRRVVVVNRQGSLEGIIALDDLIDLLAEQMRDLVELISCERKKEQRRCV